MPHLGQKEWQKSVADKGSSWRKIAMMLPEWKVRGGERKGLDNVFSIN